MLSINNSEYLLADRSSVSTFQVFGNIMDEEYVKNIRAQVDGEESFEMLTSGNYLAAVYISSQPLWLLA